MTYIKVQWIHDFEDEPILLYSELDSMRNEVRKVEVYKNNELGYACFSKTEIPSLEDINLDVQFEACEIDKEYFESIWHKAVSIDGI